MDKKVIFFDQHNDGCSLYRIRTPYDALSMKYNYIYKLKDLPKQYDSMYNHIDTFVFHRIEQPYFHKEFFPWLKSRNKKIIIDIDDNLWEIPDYNRAGVYWNSDRLNNLTLNYKYADEIICSTVTLADYISEHINKNVTVIPNMLSGIYQYRESSNEVPHVIWAGSPTHEGDFSETLILTIKQLLARKRITFTVFGEIPTFFKECSNINHVKWCKVDDYHKTLYDLKADIGLIVCKNNLFNDCKSNLKYLEYSNCSMVSIADAVHPYYSTITHGTNGYIADNQNDWHQYLIKLIENPDLVNKISKNAHTFVTENFNIGHKFDAYINHWEGVL